MQSSHMLNQMEVVTTEVNLCVHVFNGGCNPRLNRQFAAALADSGLVNLRHLKHSNMIEASPLIAEYRQRFLRTRQS